MQCNWIKPIRNSAADKLASERVQAFSKNWLLDPIILGRYPREMVEILGSTLPEFSNSYQEKLNTGLDFIGLNNYTSFYAQGCIYSLCKNGPGNSKTEGFCRQSQHKNGVPIGQPVRTLVIQ